MVALQAAQSLQQTLRSNPLWQACADLCSLHEKNGGEIGGHKMQTGTQSRRDLRQ